MERFCSSLRFKGTWVCLLAILTPLALITNTALAITASIGRPYQGKLRNGIPFPREFRGYQLREAERTYTTPEVVGALLDAIEGVSEQFPGTCDLYMGDFSRPDGGPLNNHRSHQNGRDVDLAMYPKGNNNLDRFIPMNKANLDVARTWHLVESLLRSQKIQYIFVDRNIQKLLYGYALSRGQSKAYLDQLFGNARGAVIQHVRGHQDHMHVRFFTPWSTLAGQLREIDNQKQKVIEMAQQAFLPKKVQYYVKGDEPNLKALAQSFGVTSKDLCRWNRLRGNDALTPGSCLVFYKRGFELEPVHLAQTLQPNLALDTSPIQLASLSPKVLRDLSPSKITETSRKRRKTIKMLTCKVQKGDTLGGIAERNGVTVEALCKLNGIKKSSVIKLGQVLKIGQKEVVASVPAKRRGGSEKTLKNSTYTVRSGDTLGHIADNNSMDVDTLCKLNGFKKDATIRPGQKLKVFSSKHVANTSKRSSAEKPPTASKKKTNVKTHTTKSGESLWAIARKYNTTTQLICRLNGFSSKDTLQPGIKIKLP